MQCAAVISRFLPGLETTLAVQKWLPAGPCSNSAPTRSPERGQGVQTDGHRPATPHRQHEMVTAP
jgi:hypothetical protein